MIVIGKSLLIMITGGLLLSTGPPDCGDEVADILDRIERVESDSDAIRLSRLLACLSEPAREFVRDYDSFASEEVLDEIERKTAENRLRVIKVAVPLSASKDWLVSQEAAAALAYYGYTPAGQMLDEYPDGPLKAVLYAIVGYDRSYRWAVDQFRKIERSSKPDSSLKKARMAYLNLMFHLAEPQSLPFLNEVISSGNDGELKARADLAKNRILELHPELR